MLEVQWQAEGYFALLTDPRFPRILRRVVRAAHRQAWREWASLHGRGRIGLRARFGRGAFSKFGFTRRTPGYRKRQRKILGAEMPYQSPDRRPISLHMRGMMKTEGLGYRIQLKNGGDDVQSILKLPGARAMNTPQNKIYKREFLALDRRPREAAWLSDRIAWLVHEELMKRADRAGRKIMRSAA